MDRQKQIIRDKIIPSLEEALRQAREAIGEPIQQVDRSAAAKKAWETMRQKEANFTPGQKAALTRKRRAAAKKAVATRRANES